MCGVDLDYLEDRIEATVVVVVVARQGRVVWVAGYDGYIRAS